MITIERKKLEQVLEALQNARYRSLADKIVDPSITVIKEALAQPAKGLFIDLIAQHEGLADELAQPDYRAVKTYHEGKPVYVSQPEQEPVAYFDWLPEEATHIAQIKVKTRSGGRLEMGAYVFKYDNEVLMVYTTDNDNEYPGWREAKQCFYHLNFPVFPIPNTPPKRPWVGLTDERMWELWNSQGDDAMEQQAAIAFARAIEAKLKEKNT